MPCCSDSGPSVGLTVWTDWRVSSTGRAPAFSTRGEVLGLGLGEATGDDAGAVVIGLCTAGDEMISRSTTIAIWFCGGGWLHGRRGGLAERVGAVAVQLELDLPLLATWDCVPPPRIAGRLRRCRRR